MWEEGISLHVEQKHGKKKQEWGKGRTRVYVESEKKRAFSQISSHIGEESEEWWVPP